MPAPHSQDHAETHGKPKVEDLAMGEAPASIAEERAAVERLGMEYENVPISSVFFFGGERTRALAEPEALKDSQTPVYIHYQSGIDRSGLLESMYPVEVQHQPKA